MFLAWLRFIFVCRLYFLMLASHEGCLPCDVHRVTASYFYFEFTSRPLNFQMNKKRNTVGNSDIALNRLLYISRT